MLVVNIKNALVLLLKLSQHNILQFVLSDAIFMKRYIEGEKHQAFCEFAHLQSTDL